MKTQWTVLLIPDTGDARTFPTEFTSGYSAKIQGEIAAYRWFFQDQTIQTIELVVLEDDMLSTKFSHSISRPAAIPAFVGEVQP